MKLSLDNAPFISREDGSPVEGRLTVYVHESDTPANLFTLEGDSYVAAPNPVLLHGGYPDDSLFVDAGVVDLRVEKYIGPDGGLSSESPDEDFAAADRFEFGMDFDPDSASRNLVDNVDDLREADPFLGVVTVKWYATPGDCFPRIYVWDAAAQNQEDGGYVISSNVSDTGRWILAWGDEVLPCTVYGVVPGEESNINLLLNYPDTVGSFALRTAPCVRFVAGTYTANLDYATPKELCFDKGARFLYSSFVCPSARTFGKPTNYVADFGFTGTGVTAYSSMFRTAREFLTCGAHRLVIDADNFSDRNIAAATEVESAVVEFGIQSSFTYTGNGRITFNKCELLGQKMFRATDILKFANMEIHDSWWANTNTIDFVTNVNARSVSLCKVLLANFSDAAAWLRAKDADGATSVNLEGRHVSSFYSSRITEYSNMDIGTLSVITQYQNVVLRNVRCSSLFVTANMLSLEDCHVTFGEIPNIQALAVDGGYVSSSVQWTTPIPVSATGCKFAIVLNYATDNDTDIAGVSLYDCDLQANAFFYVKRLSLVRCRTSNATIKVYPYKSGNDYILYAVLIDNLFNNSAPVEFTRFDSVGGVTQTDVYDCKLQWQITGNEFLGNAEGIRMRYWADRYDVYHPERVFVSEAANVHSIVYKDNRGNCPDVSFAKMSITNPETGYVEVEEGSLRLFKYPAARRRAMAIPRGNWWNSSSIDGNGLMVKYYSWVTSPYDSLTYDLFIEPTWFIYAKAHDIAVGTMDNGDFFDRAVVVIGDYIRIVQRGDGDHNQGIVARIV